MYIYFLPGLKLNLFSFFFKYCLFLIFSICSLDNCKILAITGNNFFNKKI